MSAKTLGVQESLDFIIDHMAIKSDVAEIKSDIGEIRSDIGEIKETLGEHTRQLDTLQSDMNIMRDKRLRLEVRTSAIEKHIGLKPPVGTVD